MLPNLLMKPLKTRHRRLVQLLFYKFSLDERDLDIIYLDRNNEWNDFWIYYGYNNDSDFDEGLDIGFNKHYNFNDDFNSDKSDQRHEFGFEFSFWNLDRIFYCYPGNFNHYGLYF
ncbi:unnamed protein product, partial [Mesorhabditis spiculigera]